jgi:hypothetical protein
MSFLGSQWDILLYFFIPNGSEKALTNTAAGDMKMKKNSESQTLLWKLPRRREKVFQDCQRLFLVSDEGSLGAIFSFRNEDFRGSVDIIPTKAPRTSQIRIRSHLLKFKLNLE